MPSVRVSARAVPSTHEGDGITLGARVVAVIAAFAAPVPASWHARAHPDWYRAALCIHRHEGAWNANTGNGYYGGMQFLATTWKSVGGVVRPDFATPREQLYRAWLVYRRDGSHWWIGDGGEWGDSARACGLE